MREKNKDGSLSIVLLPNFFPDARYTLSKAHNIESFSSSQAKPSSLHHDDDDDDDDDAPNSRSLYLPVDFATFARSSMFQIWSQL